MFLLYKTHEIGIQHAILNGILLSETLYYTVNKEITDY